MWIFPPTPLLEMAANGLLRGVLGRIKQRLLTQLLEDYHHWTQQTSSDLTATPPLSSALKPLL